MSIRAELLLLAKRRERGKRLWEGIVGKRRKDKLGRVQTSEIGAF